MRFPPSFRSASQSEGEFAPAEKEELKWFAGEFFLEWPVVQSEAA